MMDECCAKCRLCLDLEKCDYSYLSGEKRTGEFRTKMEGYACMAFASDGVVTWMVGNPNKSMCEAFVPKENV